MTMMAPFSEMLSVALATSGFNTVNFDPQSCPIEVVRWGIIASSSVTSGVSAAIQLNKRVTAGSDTGLVDAAGGVLNLATANDPDTVAGSGIYSAPVEQLIVLPGEQLQVEVTDAGSAGVVRCFVHFYRLPFQKPGQRLAFDGSPMALLSPAGLPERDFLINMTAV